jgi:carbonic anhydrase
MDINKEVKNKEILDNITPAKALEMLKDGNNRFLNKDEIERDHDWHIKETIDGQHPFAIVHGCVDSRVLPSIIFDQGIGDLFVSRIAGNIINQDILGSMEYACSVVGSKLVVVLGHTSCGAVKGATDNVKLGNLTASLKHIKFAASNVKTIESEARNSSNLQYVNNVAVENVLMAIDDIKNESKILSDMYKNGDIDIIGAMYHHDTGKVVFI